MAMRAASKTYKRPVIQSDKPNSIKPPLKFAPPPKRGKLFDDEEEDTIVSEPCEGYWNLNYKPQDFVSKGWKDKSKFLKSLKVIEEKLKSKPPGFKSFKGYSYSRFAKGNIGDKDRVGSGEFNDMYNNKRICWPEGYGEHYIGLHDVMPTKRFYNYVISRSKK